MANATIIVGDAIEKLKTLPDESMNCCVTSPPYWGLRDYGANGQMGLEKTPAEYVANMVAVFNEVRRVLKNDGTLWLNLGDSYARNTKGSGGPSDKQERNSGSWYNPRHFTHGVKQKDLVGIPWLVAFALRNAGWYLRCDIIWSKPNPMPESVKDRPTKAHEYIFLLSKSERYFYDSEAVREPHTDTTIERYKYTGSFCGGSKHKDDGTHWGDQFNPDRKPAVLSADGRNKRSVWTVATKPYPGAHFATFPPELITPCILAGCPKGGTVLDPFSGSGTTGEVALRAGRNYIGIEINPEYVEMSRQRISKSVGELYNSTKIEHENFET